MKVHAKKLEIFLKKLLTIVNECGNMYLYRRKVLETGWTKRGSKEPSWNVSKIRKKFEKTIDKSQ